MSDFHFGFFGNILIKFSIFTLIFGAKKTNKTYNYSFKTLRLQFLLYCFFLISSFAFGQVKELHLPGEGVYDKPLEFNRDSIKIAREKVFEGYVGYYDNFRRLHITKYANFYNGKFQDKVIFTNTDFCKEVNFINTIFRNKANFICTKFQNRANFNQAKFQNKINFNCAYFDNDANFLYTEFQDEVDFSGVRFQNEANFDHAKGKGQLLFDNAQMPNILNFRYIDSLKVDFRKVSGLSAYQINQIPKNQQMAQEFQLSQKLGKCVILLHGTNLANIILPYDRFWVEINGYSYEETTSMYEKLIKVCKDEGMDESVEGWSIELQKTQNIHNKAFTFLGLHFTFWGYVWNAIQSIFWNYGYSKGYIFFWIMGTFLIFTLLNYTFWYPKLLGVYYNPKLGTNLFTNLPNSAEELITSLKKNKAIRWRYMLHFTGVIFFGLKLEHSDMSFKHLRWVMLLYFEFIIGIILLGFALNFVLK